MVKEKSREAIPIELSKIEISEQNVRKEGAEQELDELAESIKAVGLINPILVKRKSGAKDEFELIVGQRRYLAHKKLGRKFILAFVDDRMSEDDELIKSLVENVHRVEINHADAARATTALYKRFDKKIEKVKKVSGLSRRRIEQYVDIEEVASPATKRKLKEGKVKPADVQRVIRAAQRNMAKADEMLEMMEKYELDKYQKGRLVEYGEEHPTWSANKIVTESLKPIIERSVVVPLSPKLRDGLQRAVDSCKRGADEIAVEALGEWLRKNGYL